MSNPFAPQLLHSPSWYADTEPPMPDNGEWIMEPKLDGWRVMFHVTEERTVELYGRSGKLDYRIPDYLIDELVGLFPADTIIDAELVVPGGQSTDVATALANHRAKPLRAFAFDLIRLTGQDIRHLPWSARRTLLEQALEQQDGASCVQATLICEPDLRVFLGWMDLGLEGVVLKRKESVYSSGARTMDWVKIKPQQTVDCRIVGFVAGAGKYARMIGAVEFELEPGLIGRASGMTDLVRQEMTDHPERFIGKLAEFAYQQRTTSGMLRHPQYRRLREDLEPEQSTPKERKMPKQTAASKPAADGWSRRNYRAMSLEKLNACILELQAESGDAYERCVAKGADPNVDLEHARAAYAEKEKSV